MSTVEYRVRPVSRYVVTRYEDAGNVGSVETIGEFDNEQQAMRVMAAMRLNDPLAEPLPPHAPPS